MENNIEAELKKIHWNKSLKVKYDVDVAVVGGGIAGVSAACSASEKGDSVILIERFAMLGGVGTTGGVEGFCGETRGVGKVFDEIVSDLEKFNAISKYVPPGKSFFQARHYDHQILAVVLQEICCRYGVKLLLHTRFIDCIAENNEIKNIIVAGKSGIEAIKAKVYIDCSGEADLAFSAGCETIKGGDKSEYQLPMSLMYYVRETTRRKKTRIPSSYFNRESYKKRSDLPMTSLGRKTPHTRSVKIKVPMYDATNTESLTDAEIEGHRKMMCVLDYYQSQQKKKWELDHCSSIIGIREGRRIIGEYILTVEDLRDGREFEDAVAVGTFPLDGHKPDDDKRTYILPRSQLKVPPYHIPIRCLIPKGWKNLLVAGRILSSDQLALSSARVMATCAMMGQAVGITARLCIKKNKNCLELIDDSFKLISQELIANKTQLKLGEY